MNELSGKDDPGLEGGPKIVCIELTPVRVPFREIVRGSMQSGAGGLGMAIPAEEEWTGGECVICRLIAEDGSAGLGESFVWLPESGVSPAQVIDAVAAGLSGYVLGKSPFNIERIRHRMSCNVTRSEAAKGLLDMACYDLMGRVCKRPAHDFMGGRSVDEVPLTALIPLMDLEAMAGMAAGFKQSGMKTFRVKLGRSISEDIKIMERMRDDLGEDVRLRVDYNQAYSPAQAVRAIKAIERFGIDVAEQPVRSDDYLGMAYVQSRVDTPLMSHEGCFSLRDVVTLIELGAIRVVGLTTARLGGISDDLRAVAYAEQRGLGVVIHNQPLGIASAMHVHFAAAKHYSLGHHIELFGHIMLEDDLIAEPIDYSGGTASVPAGPGWGVELDHDALDRYRTGDTVKLEAG